ncbi:MAG: hypothetical protein ACK4N5_07320 [Myxococcales bacterium]
MPDPRDPFDPEEKDPLDEPGAEERKAEWPRDFGSQADDDVGEETRRLGGMQDMLRKVMVAGLGAVFMTEEGIRQTLKDLKLPKEVMGFVLGQAEKSKAELMRVISEEVRRFFESAQLRQEVIKLLSHVTIEVKAEVRLKPEGEAAVEPEISVKDATIKRRRNKGS